MGYVAAVTILNRYHNWSFIGCMPLMSTPPAGQLIVTSISPFARTTTEGQ